MLVRAEVAREVSESIQISELYKAVEFINPKIECAMKSGFFEVTLTNRISDAIVDDLK